MSPEYAMEGLFSVKSDVFSFGVLLLEIISGKRNSGFYLSEHVLEEDTYIASEVLKCIHIGLLCVQEDAADRPTMSLVVVMLASETMTLPNPKNPAFSVGRMTKEESSTSKNSKDPSVNEVTVTHIIPR
ncbi:Cysteine-rich receptor-like protein kinase 10 [Senna tora]|uniref:Cysteine-rich receptor-like protein kinase 10 n=1 Tax=Senna tora TaxID=362788 RepID=A0A834X0T1_9FABA|nr:Cysteine-rich receptor-like protein kinase 10 [Senna tora]